MSDLEQNGTEIEQKNNRIEQVINLIKANKNVALLLGGGFVLLCIMNIIFFVSFGHLDPEKRAGERADSAVIIRPYVLGDEDLKELNIIAEHPAVIRDAPKLKISNDVDADEQSEELMLKKAEKSRLDKMYGDLIAALGDDARDYSKGTGVLLRNVVTDGANVSAWKKYAAKGYKNTKGVPKVVIVIDDMGVNHKMSNAVIDMKGPLTLSFLPYATGIDEMSKRGKKHGHEIMLHMPMEPLGKNEDLGPDTLMTSMSDAKFVETLDKNFSELNGFVGINNHMGSKLTQDTEKMRIVMREMRQRGLLFLDSKTIASSIADGVAESYGVYHADRDVFIDHFEDYQSAKKSLDHLVAVAKRNGTAIAIGHPKENTIRALYEWIPTLKDKGVELVPISAVVSKADNPHRVRVTLSE